jgi:hypothetical protein
MAEAKQSPKFAKDGPPPPAFTNMLANMKINLTETNLALIRGTSEQ